MNFLNFSFQLRDGLVSLRLFVHLESRNVIANKNFVMRAGRGLEKNWQLTHTFREVPVSIKQKIRRV